MGVEAEEELNVLHVGQTQVVLSAEAGENTYTHSVGQGAIHVSQEEVSELDGI